ncbi:MAG: enolase C-terminal domain-like protein [Patescibacteria group bacterium]
MIVRRVDVAPLTYRLKRPFIFAGVRLEQLGYAIVRVSTEAGVVGYGECPVYGNPRGETQVGTIGAVKKLTAAVAGRQFSTPEQWGRILATTMPTAYAVACGLDSALHDALGQEDGMPVYRYYGHAKPVPVEAAIPMVALSEVAGLVRSAIERGITTYKVKVGTNTDREYQLLRLVRAAIGPERTLFVDANQGWKTVDDAAVALRTFADIHLAWVEQPLPAACALKNFRILRERVGIPIMLDESVYTADDARAAATAGAAQLFNIKLAKSRGIWGAHQFAQVVEDGGGRYMLGSMIEGALGTYAGVHFASTHAVQTSALNAYAFINDDRAFGPPLKNGCMVAPDTPGLGYGCSDLFAACFKKDAPY